MGASKRMARFFNNPLAINNKQPFPFVSSIILGDKMHDRNKKTLIEIAAKKGWTVFERKLCSSGSRYAYRPLTI